MAFDFSQALGGASAGAGFGGPAGAIVGGLVGGFLNKPAPEQYNDPEKGTIDAQIDQLTQSHIGADLASRQASAAKRQANLSMQSLQNRPGFNNAAVLGGLYDAANEQAESSAMDATLKGAAYDQQQKAEGATLAQRQSVRDQQIWNENKDLRDRPNALQSIGLSALGSLAGGSGPLAGLAGADQTMKSIVGMAGGIGAGGGAVSGGNGPNGDAGLQIGSQFGQPGSADLTASMFKF